MASPGQTVGVGKRARSGGLRRWGRALPLAAVVVLFGSHDRSVDALQARTASDRVYSEAQAKRGQALYVKLCASCHAESLQGQSGPPLTGAAFLSVWGKQPLSDLVNKIKDTMPEDDPGKLTRQQSADLVALILQVGKFPAGPADLGADEAALKLITMPAGQAPAATPVPLAAGHTPTFPPPGNMAQMMRGILFPSSNIIFNVQGNNPDDVKAAATGSKNAGGFSWADWGAGIYKPWEIVDYAAIAISDSAPLLLTPGRRCENGKPVPVDQPDWIRFTEEMAEAGRAAYRASQTRNQEAVSEATNQIADSCLNCHQVYRDRRVPGQSREPGDKSNRCTVPEK